MWWLVGYIFFKYKSRKPIHRCLSFLVHKAEINVLKWYNASANTTERQRKTPSWSEESAVLIWNTHGLDPLGFYLDAWQRPMLRPKLHGCSWMASMKFFYYIKEMGNFHQVLSINWKLSLLLTWDLAPSVINFQLICARCKFYLTESKSVRS